MLRAIPWLSVVVGLSSSIAYCGTLAPTYGTYFGGTGGTSTAVAVALDPSGNVIMVGTTSSQTLPGTANVFQPTKATGFPNNLDVFIAKFDPTGRKLLWATFLGGNGDDTPSAVAVDSSGNIYVAGTTQSSNFPAQSSITCTAGAGYFDFSSSPPFQQNCSVTLGQSSSNGSFIAKISSDGTELSYSVTLSGLRPTALTVDSHGEAYLATNGPGASEALFLFRLSLTGSLVYGAFLGGGDIGFDAQITALTVDSQGDCYVAGAATINVPTTANALQTANSNANLNLDLGNGFILEVNPTGTQLVYGTWFGPEYYATSVASIAINADGSVYFAGSTNATSFQTTPGAYLSKPGAGFIAKLTLGSTTLSAFSYLPFQSPGCGTGGFLSSCGSVVMTISSQPQTAYLLFYSNGTGGAGEVLELNLPSLGASRTPLYTVNTQTGFNPLDIVLASSSNIWVVGGCTSCSLGNLISADAFQSTPSSTSQNAVLLELTNISPAISFIGSSATGTSPFAANQLVSIFGTQLGPTVGSSLQVGPDGAITTMNSGTQVLFDGVAAPILYTTATQVNAVIPCSVAGHKSAKMVVEYLGAQSASLTVALSPAAPGIFTDNSSGTGQGAVLNADYSLNSPSNPAARGSFVSIYATGAGPTSPCVDGQIYQSNFPTLTLPAIVGVGRTGAHVLYAGQAPDLVSGIAQFTVVIPDNATGVLPLTLVVGGVSSPSGVTIAVK